jgi:DNA (cytosine-5)-methyltransferase 1
MKVLDLFSGIGGFSIGLEEAGFETAAFCEIEDYPRAVLRKHWPDTPIYRDVRQLTGEQLRADGIVPDLLCGGYPCQPFSVAGRQRGEEDPRHLWPEVHRLIRELRPRWVVCENVSGHIKLGLDEVLSTLEAEGYTCWPFIIPACSVDAPHKRDRVWIVAHADSSSDRRTSRQYEEADGKVSQRDNGRFFDQSGEVCAAMADTNVNDGGREGSTEPQGRNSRMEHGGSSFGQLVGRASQDMANTDSDRLQGCSKEPLCGVGDLQGQLEGSGEALRGGWPVEPNVGRVVDGLPRRSHRIKALGNAIVPQIAQAIGETIMRFEETRGE